MNYYNFGLEPNVFEALSHQFLWRNEPFEGLNTKARTISSVLILKYSFWHQQTLNLLIWVPPGMPKTVVTKVCTHVQIFYLRTTLWNMETTSKLWDLNCEVESLKKVGFLCYQDAPNYSWEKKGEGDARNKTYLIYSKEVMHQNRNMVTNLYIYA